MFFLLVVLVFWFREIGSRSEQTAAEGHWTLGRWFDRNGSTIRCRREIIPWGRIRDSRYRGGNKVGFSGRSRLRFEIDPRIVMRRDMRMCRDLRLSSVMIPWSPLG